ncbi:MAG: PAS domain S-box protein, partial [Desulfovibrionaceae bacterium]|nr:PAS domain S-box protein [Desulfovibrionaceae bacterium]
MPEKTGESARTKDLRDRAESILAAARDEALSCEPGLDARLLHELQVHKIELELQNEALRQSRDELEASLAQYADLFDFSPVSCFVLDGHGKIARTNFAGAHLLGLERSRALDSYFRQFVATGDRKFWDDFFRQMLASPARMTREISLQTPQGLQHALVQGAGDPGAGGCRLSLTDITDRKRIEEALRLATKKAQAATEAKNEFLANMSHEIRTPLNGVLGMLQLLEMTALDDEQKELICSAERSSKRLNQLLADILDLSRIETGNFFLCESEFRLEDVLTSLADLLGAPAREKGLDLDCIVDGAVPPALVVDDHRLLQILLNLAGNAVKFTAQGGVRVEAAALPGDGKAGVLILFTVTDTGIGIADHKVHEIFEPFVQGEPCGTKRYQGAGLGLSIVRKLVTLMGGSLSLSSAETEGTAIYFSLPFRLPDRLRETTPRDLTAAAVRRLRVLVVEDDEVSLQVGKLMLEAFGHTVIHVSDDRDALRLLAEEAFDLVLMDVQ